MLICLLPQLVKHVFYRFCEVLSARVVNRVIRFWEIYHTSARHHVHHVSYVVRTTNGTFPSHKNPHGKFSLPNRTPIVLAHSRKNKAVREVLDVNVNIGVCVSTHACVCGLRRQTCVRGETPDHQLPSGSSAARPLCRHPSISSVPYH